MPNTTYSVPLLKRAQQLVLNAPRHITYAMMGDQIEKSSKWIGQLANGKLNNPGVATVQRLIDYLERISTEA